MRSAKRALLLALACACGGDRTALLVEVRSSDLVAPDDVDALRFEARSDLGARIDRSFPIAGPWPHSLAILPAPGETSRTVTVTVTGTRAGAFVVRRVVVTSFVPGQTRRVDVELPASCRGMECPEGVDCRAGTCAGIDVDGGAPDAGDAGVPPDALADDAGRVDAGLFDAEPFDASSGDASPGDGGPFDAASRDAASRDAGSFDGGPFDAGPRDAGALDAGPFDAGPFDAGPLDAAATDAGPPLGPTLVINEIDYDQPSTDTMEFVEILNVSAGPVDLSAFRLYFVNGASMPAAVYAMLDLSGTLAPDAYAVVHAPMVMPEPGAVSIPLGSIAIQNGGTTPDGVAIWHIARGEVVDALSYDGAITMASIAGRTVSLVSGTPTLAVDSSSVAGRTVCRFPDGRDTGDDATDFVTCSSPTPGRPNVR